MADLATQAFIDDEAKARLANFNQNKNERKKYANLIWQLTCFWCLFIGLVIIFCGMGRLKLSDAILGSLIGATTVNMCSFFYLVTQYLFNKDKST